MKRPVIYEVHVVCGADVLASRIEKILAEDSLGPESVVSTLEDLALGEHRTLIVLALETSPTKRITSIRSLAERPGFQVVVCRKTGGSEVRRAILAGAGGYVLEEELE